MTESRGAVEARGALELGQPQTLDQVGLPVGQWAKCMGGWHVSVEGRASHI
jgi:hypothetical protein